MILLGGFLHNKIRPPFEPIARSPKQALMSPIRSDRDKYASPRCCALWNSGTYAAVRFGIIVPSKRRDRRSGIAPPGWVYSYLHQRNGNWDNKAVEISSRLEI
jgi:hypothetical protein